MSQTQEEIGLQLLGGAPISGHPDEAVICSLDFELRPVPSGDWRRIFKLITDNEFKSSNQSADSDDWSLEETKKRKVTLLQN